MTKLADFHKLLFNNQFKKKYIHPISMDLFYELNIELIKQYSESPDRMVYKLYIVIAMQYS